MKTIITKEITWHMGHRVPNHKSKCRNPHGHTYKLEAYVEGEVSETTGTSEEGMVQDFSDIKDSLVSRIFDVLDHGFMMHVEDVQLRELFFQRGISTLIPRYDWNIIAVDFVPTAENIAKWCYNQLKEDIDNDQRKLKGVKIWETPTSTAYYGN